MSNHKRLAPVLVAGALLAVPTAATAATLTPSKPCFGDGDRVVISGAGFTPGAAVNVSSTDGSPSGQLASGPAGQILGRVLPRPLTSGPERSFAFTATDSVNPANTATTQVRRSPVRVRITPRDTRPTNVRRFAARGFTTGRTLYKHISRRGKHIGSRRVGKLKGACHTLSARGRLFAKNTRTGRYSVQFDAYRRYSRKRLQAVRFSVRVYRYRVWHSGRASAAAATQTREMWTQVQ